VNEWQQLIVVP